jgi:hypothetical protein
MGDLHTDARRAMFTRLAGGLAVLAHADQVTWTCCHQDFRHAGSTWGWRFCNGGMPGEPFATQPCGHWHHRHDPPLIAMAVTLGVR